MNVVNVMNVDNVFNGVLQTVNWEGYNLPSTHVIKHIVHIHHINHI